MYPAVATDVIRHRDRGRLGNYGKGARGHQPDRQRFDDPGCRVQLDLRCERDRPRHDTRLRRLDFVLYPKCQQPGRVCRLGD